MLKTETTRVKQLLLAAVLTVFLAITVVGTGFTLQVANLDNSVFKTFVAEGSDTTGIEVACAGGGGGMSDGGSGGC